ncbi:methyltransferase domain-containing protein [Candidatus Bathyarchaeota archaeon]|nr:MAG: methyltransferase domain-containing protein [Candidatus Bathyarchaeota archaeon]
MGPIAVPIKGCRLCHSRTLVRILSLGNQHVSDFVTAEGDSPQSPLELMRCTSCTLVQLKHTFPRDSLYRHYWYRSGISSTMRKALEDIVVKSCEIAQPKNGDIVVDIGCNDGTLLRSYKIPGLRLVGFEPAKNLVEEARKGTELVFNDFFGYELFKQKFPGSNAKLITSIAMFYDLDDPDPFVADTVKCLDARGVWVIQQNYLCSMLEQNDVNGGSFRTYVSRKGQFPVQESVREMKEFEKKLFSLKPLTYSTFANNVRRVRLRLREFIADQTKSGRTVYVYGASTRGNTILQYCKLNHHLIKKATDANPEKWGLKTPGTEIPIVSKAEARRDRPDFFLVLPHHFLTEIMKEEKEYLESGGKFIVPLPEFRIVEDSETAKSNQADF